MSIRSASIESCLKEIDSTIGMFESELNDIQTQARDFGDNYGMRSSEQDIIDFISDSIKNLTEERADVLTLISDLKKIRKKAVRMRRSNNKARRKSRRKSTRW